jgi:adenylate cyclase
MPQFRQLAAIMFTDIVGYTALMGDDERKAFELLKKNRELQKPIIEQYNGRWIKELGDGVMASFNTVSDAVNAAIKIQEACNATKEFKLRIGIHLGEVVFENDDVFGDGVNIASRIQAITEPGEIYISESVHNNVSNKQGIETRFVKKEVLKNVKEPVRIYEVITTDSLSYPNKTNHTKIEQDKENNGKKTSKRLIFFTAITIIGISLLSYFVIPLINKNKNNGDNKWVAVLPFRLISSDSSLIWLSDGFTEELTSSVAGISNLKVKSPTTMMQYKNSKKSIREISEELNVSSIIDGSLQKEGNSIIIIARLINPLTEEILHNFKFKKDASEIKIIYSELALQIADILNATITSEEKKRLQQVVKVDPELYNLYLQGMHYAKDYTLQGYREAIKIFDKAIKKDSNYAPVLAGKAFVIATSFWFAPVSSVDAIKQTDALLAKAIALDSNLSLAYSSIGWVQVIRKWNFYDGEKNFLKSFYLDPSDDIALTGLIYVNLCNSKLRESTKWWETGKAISPYSGWVDGPNATILYLSGKIPEAIQFIRNTIAEHNVIVFYDKLGWIYNLSGQHKEAIEILEKEIKIFNARPASTIAWLASSYYQSGNKVKAGELLKELEDMVEKKTPNVAFSAAAAYASIGEKQKALNFLDKAFELHDVDMIWLKIDPHFKSIQNEVRYEEMLKKVGFDKYL